MAGAGGEPDGFARQIKRALQRRGTAVPNIVAKARGVRVKHGQAGMSCGKTGLGRDRRLQIASDWVEAGRIERAPVVLEIQQFLISREMTRIASGQEPRLAIHDAVPQRDDPGHMARDLGAQADDMRGVSAALDLALKALRPDEAPVVFAASGFRRSKSAS